MNAAAKGGLMRKWVNIGDFVPFDAVVPCHRRTGLPIARVHGASNARSMRLFAGRKGKDALISRWEDQLSA